MRKLLGLMVIIGVVGVFLTWQLAGQESKAPRPKEWRFAPPDPDAVGVITDKRMGGIYPVGSRLPDREALGGFGGCDNFPLNLGDNAWGEKGKLSLVVDPEEAVAYFKFRGIALRLVNRTDDVKAFRACDSCLYLVQEAQDEQGKWCEIEELPQTHCGNSFHRVF